MHDIDFKEMEYSDEYCDGYSIGYNEGVHKGYRRGLSTMIILVEAFNTQKSTFDELLKELKKRQTTHLNHRPT